MKVRDLVAELQKENQEADVIIVKHNWEWELDYEAFEDFDITVGEDVNTGAKDEKRVFIQIDSLPSNQEK